LRTAFNKSLVAYLVAGYRARRLVIIGGSRMGKGKERVTYSNEQKKLALKLWLEGKTDRDIAELAKIQDSGVIRVWRHRHDWEQFRLSPTAVDTEKAELSLDEALQNVDATVKGHFYAYRRIRLKVLKTLNHCHTPLQILQAAQALDIAVKGERQALGIEQKSNEPREIDVNLSFKRPEFNDGKPVIDVTATVVDQVARQLEGLDIQMSEISGVVGEPDDELVLYEQGDEPEEEPVDEDPDLDWEEEAEEDGW
jgi:hypothetical protein